MFQTFFEPANGYDYGAILPLSLRIIESFVLVIYLCDLGMEAIHLWSDYDRMFKEKFVLNLKFSFKFFVLLMLLVDYIVFYVNFPDTPLRFARYLRPGNFIVIKIICYTKSIGLSYSYYLFL
jgi:hypothetical protein